MPPQDVAGSGTPESLEPNEEGAEPSIVVGIGSSAGGFEAAAALLNSLPHDTGMAFVLVQHLDPHHSSALSELLGQRTKMPVIEVADGTVVRANRFYVIPPNVRMTIMGGLLSLMPRIEVPGRYMPIDVFFRSLAEDRKSTAIGVILSGTASDGTLGLKAIKAEGGFTFAQDESAKFDGMPRSAIAAGVVDFVLPPEDIAKELADIARHPHHNGAALPGLYQDSPEFLEILRLLRTAAGIDFSQYRPNTLLRRIERRIVLQKAGDPDQYLQILRDNPVEIRALSDDLLISVTEFFRDPPIFEALKEKVFPEILGKKESGEAIRVWVPGCSTGEEVYSIAIGLMEFLRDAGTELPVHIFGTDVSEINIERARAGVYGSSSVSSISPQRLGRFFMAVDSGYQIVRPIRDLCVFAVQNVASDPPFSRIDLISCRNLLIYMGPALQQRVVGMLAYALQPNGFLVLGKAERPGHLADHFTPFDAEHNLYLRKPVTVHPGFELPARVAAFPVFRQDERPAERESKWPGESAPGPLQRQVDRLLLAQYAPPSVVIDDNYRIVQFSGEVGSYLAPERGEADLNLFRIVRDDVALHVRAAVEAARQKGMAIRLERIHISGARPRTITVAVTPVAVASLGRHFLISFEDPASPPALPGEPLAPMDGATRSEETGDPQSQIAQLEEELASTRRYLQSIIEEVRSANEEAQSTNEELQSSNEELQTAKEELQATNEELQTLNAEMDSRNVDLKRLADDLLNLLASLQTPILMLDSALRIRRFTQVSEKLLNLIATDIGRPVSDLQPRIKVPRLQEILRQVVDTLAPHEEEVQDRGGRWYSLRVRPYRTSDNHIDGAVLQLVDIDELKKSLEEARLARDYASAILQTVREPLVVLDSQFRIETANRAFFQTFHTPPEESLKKLVYEVAGGRLDFPKLHYLLDHAARGDSAIEDVELERDFEQLGRRTMLLNARRIEDDGGNGPILLVFEDITERKRSAEARYRRLFEAAKDGMLIVDAETGEISDANPYLEALFGYRRDELVGRKVWEVDPLCGIPDPESVLARIRERDMERFPDLVVKSKSGRAIHVEVVGNVYMEGARAQIQFNIRDITERRQFERQLQHTQKLESLGLLAGGVAHDFNNLLTGIMGNASLGLADLPDSSPERRYFREIISAGKRAADLTRQMLAYAGKGRFLVERMDVSQLIREIEPLINTSIPKLVSVQLELKPGLPAIEADSGQIQQLIMNLMINGAEAIGEDRPGVVLVRTSTWDLSAEDIQRDFPNDRLTPGQYVSIEVRDTGSGMDEATRARIFDPFFTTKFEGRGLGLAAASGIVRSHKGAMRVYSRLGQGTSFQVLFPAAPAKALGRASSGPAHALPASGTVLFVDDQETLQQLAHSALERNGWHVLPARNGAQAVEVFERLAQEITVVILDLAMPVMGGEEALERLKAIRTGVPVILSTGYGEDEARRRFAGKDVAGFLQKPYTVDQLMEAIALVLGRL